MGSPESRRIRGATPPKMSVAVVGAGCADRRALDSPRFVHLARPSVDTAKWARVPATASV